MSKGKLPKLDNPPPPPPLTEEGKKWANYSRVNSSNMDKYYNERINFRDKVIALLLVLLVVFMGLIIWAAKK